VNLDYENGLFTFADTEDTNVDFWAKGAFNITNQSFVLDWDVWPNG